MNGVVAIRTAPYQGQVRAVVMGGMTLQTQRRLADREQILIWRTVRRMTFLTVFIYRRMLVRKGTLVLGVALETKLISARHLQVVA